MINNGDDVSIISSTYALFLYRTYRYKLLGGLAVRRACYGVLRFVMEQGAKGAEVVVSGKLRAQRAKSMKFSDGYMIKSGQAKKGKFSSDRSSIEI